MRERKIQEHSITPETAVSMVSLRSYPLLLRVDVEKGVLCGEVDAIVDIDISGRGIAHAAAVYVRLVPEDECGPKPGR